MLDIIIKDDRWSLAMPDLQQSAIKAAAQALVSGWTMELHGGPCLCEIAILFAGDGFVRDLNARYRQKNRATNVLSFPAQSANDFARRAEGPLAPLLLGDIVLAYDYIVQEADENHIPPAAHARHLIVHGILHLLGYDHIDNDDAEKMEQLETMILHSLGDPDPYGRESRPVR